MTTAHPTATNADDDEALIDEIVRRVRGGTEVDLADYKLGTLRRQIHRRVLELGCPSLGDYVARLQHEPAELHRLRRCVLIPVTHFFRDAEVFRLLGQVLRELLARKPDGEALRIWIPGCASGEEAYSVAILVLETMASLGLQRPVRLFATDVDDDAIAAARLGVYGEDALRHLDPAWVERYFLRIDRGYTPTRRVRDLCVFAAHDLLTQPTFVNLDLLSCRNVMIYFQPQVQADVLARFHQSLAPHGWLLLGQSESAGADSALFALHDKTARLYRKRAAPAAATLLPGDADGLRPFPGKTMLPMAAHRRRSVPEAAFHQWLLQRDALPSALVDGEGRVLHLWGDVNHYLRLGTGTDFSLASLIQPELRDEARSLLQLAQTLAPAEACSPLLDLQPGGHPSPLRLRARALGDDESLEPLVALSFEARAPTTARPDAERQALRDELAVARDQLHALTRELELSRRDNQGLREELQASSEELQSSNEELQASNEELITLNEQLSVKSEELSTLNDVLLSVERSVQHALVVVDTQLCVTRFNPLAVRIFGLLDSDVGRPLAAVPSSLPLDDLPRQLAQVLRTGESLIARADHGDRHFVVQLSSLRDRYGLQTGAIVCFIDDAELHRAEAERARLAAIVTHSEDAIVGKTLDGIITSWNPGAERLFGYAAGEAIGRPMLIVFPPELQADESALLARIARGETVPPFDTVRLHRSGRRVHVSVALSPIRDRNGQTIGVSKIARDISDRVADEAMRSANLQRLAQLVDDRTHDLADKEQQLQSVLDGMPGLVAYWDTGLSLQYANQPCRRLMSALDPAADPSVHELATALHPATSEWARPHVAAVLRGTPSEFEVGPLSGAPGFPAAHYRVSYMPLRRAGEVVGFIALMFDISAIKKAEVEAAAASRAKSEFLAGMSHEIRTPLNAVLGLAQVGLQQRPADPMAEIFRHILQAGQHLLGVINDILDFSKIEAGKLELQVEQTELAEVANRAIDMVGEAAREKNLVLRVHRDPTLARYYRADAVRVAQLLINLLTNAVKFTEYGVVELTLRRAHGGVLLAVRDTGPGIAPDVQQRLFAPFVQGDGSRTRRIGGSGLGLSICKRIVAMMQGRIEVHSQVGVGSTFEVWLPLEAWGDTDESADPPVASASAGTARGPRLQGVNILVAEDHPVNGMVLQHLLQAEGAQLTLVGHGGLAVQAVVASLEAGQQRYDIVLCDIEMPEMDGYEATRRIRTIDPGLSVVGLTAHAFNDARQLGEGAGMTGYVTKPFMLDDLVHAVLRAARRESATRGDAGASAAAP